MALENVLLEQMPMNSCSLDMLALKSFQVKSEQLLKSKGAKIVELVGDIKGIPVKNIFYKKFKKAEEQKNNMKRGYNVIYPQMSLMAKNIFQVTRNF